jgi:ketosteroid isomerase-like protein
VNNPVHLIAKAHKARACVRICGAAVALIAAIGSAAAFGADDKSTVAALDTEYQAAVKHNDAATMQRILADDFVLVTGKGKAFGKADLLAEARAATNQYEHQEDSEQTVRLWGDTAVVTALLWVKGRNKSDAFDYKLWFSDVYVRTPGGWRYAFGQASLRVPAA